MIEKEIHQRVTDLLTPKDLAFIIFVTFSQREMVKMTNRLGITYDGVRTSSLSEIQLAHDLAEEFFDDLEAAQLLIKTLNKRSQAECDFIKRMSVTEIKDLQTKGRLFDSPNLGRILWAIVVDEREGMYRMILPLLSEFYEAEMGRMADVVGPQRVEEAEVEIGEEVKGLFREIERDLIALKKVVSKELSKMTGQEAKEERFKKESDSLRKTVEELRQESRRLKQERDTLQKELERVEEKLKRVDLSREEELTHRINQLERENRKLSYELEKLTEEREELSRQRQRNQILSMELEEKTRQLNELRLRFNKAEVEIASLKAKRAEAEVALESKVSHPTPKEKGKRMGVFIDTQGLHSVTSRLFERRLNYKILLPFLIKDRYLVKAICYLVRTPVYTPQRFIDFLRMNGYDVRIKEITHSDETGWGEEIIADLLSVVERLDLDIVILGAGNNKLLDSIKALRSSRKVRIELLGLSLEEAEEGLKGEVDEFIPLSEEMLLA